MEKFSYVRISQKMLDAVEQTVPKHSDPRDWAALTLSARLRQNKAGNGGNSSRMPCRRYESPQDGQPSSVQKHVNPT